MCSEEEFVKVIRSIFKDGSEPIQAGTLFRTHEEWSSMQALILIATVDEHFGVTLLEKEFRSASTVADLYQLTVRLLKHG